MAVGVATGISILNAAREAGIYIPPFVRIPVYRLLTNTPRVLVHLKEKLAAILVHYLHACLTSAQQEGCSCTHSSGLIGRPWLSRGESACGEEVLQLKFGEIEATFPEEMAVDESQPLPAVRSAPDHYLSRPSS